ncbi:MAG TPA: cation diffusion facilitator family transporter [Spongiibacteraceae bacterium]|jgi:cobalt-zinc-cadmium efflux system protein
MAGHHHDHNENAQRESQRIGFAFWLNLCFTAIELIGGLLTNSVAILSNAIHDFGDTLAIGFGWLASRLAQRRPNDAYTYGYRRLSLLSALMIGLTLVIGSIIIIVNAVPRLWQPQTPHLTGMFWLALVGIVANGVAALRLHGGDTQNEKMLSWHLVEDVLGWIVVLIASLVIRYTGWSIIDPLLSIGFTLFILVNVIRNLRATLRLFLQKSPDDTLVETIRRQLQTLTGVEALHHLHVWSLDGQHHVLTAHIVLNEDLAPTRQLELKQHIHRTLQPYALAHTTIEFEFPSETCRDH